MKAKQTSNLSMIKQVFLSFFTLLLSLTVAADENPYFKIKVVDEETGRGVPLVELKTTNEIAYYTDSNGIVAFYEPGLMDLEVFFFVNSHGYSFAKDGFGMQGTRLHPKSGESVTLKLKRENIAERLYRITGQGIYRDSLLTNEPVPIKEPVLNGQVMGQDSIQRTVYKGKIYWLWGDTGRPQYPLGNFQMSGATSELPSKGGLPPEKGIDLKYFVNKEGFCRAMAPFEEKGLIWMDEPLVLKDPDGQERMIAHYNRMESLEKLLEHGLVVFNDERQEFHKFLVFDLDRQWQGLRCHPIRVQEQGQEYFYVPGPFPTVRVKADWNSVQDQSQYEAFTCLEEGTRYEGKSSKLVLENDRPVYSWKTNTPPLEPRQEQELIKEGIISQESARFLPVDTESGKTVLIHGGTVNWNEYRKKWILIGVEIMGTSMLGEVWYAESDELTGPWRKARKIVTHDKYSFYNPAHHAFFDQEGGRIIYFEGTYTKAFSGNEVSTPRYDYNQIMYRLDLGDERLQGE